jgi:hypothetical protein
METMTSNMEHLTREMNELAQKTTQETVSMRIITLVTLFFLPGTFISVGFLILIAKKSTFWHTFCYQLLIECQTIMSTDIVRFESPGGGPGPEVFEADALKLYAYISIPLMVLTFVAWYLIYKWETWKAKKKKRKALEKEASEKV